MPLCDSTTTTWAPSARALSTIFCRLSSLMPKLQSGNIQRGWAIGVYGKAWPTMPTFTPFSSRIVYGLNTISPQVASLTFWATNSMLPLRCLSMISLTRSAP